MEQGWRHHAEQTKKRVTEYDYKAGAQHLRKQLKKRFSRRPEQKNGSIWNSVRHLLSTRAFWISLAIVFTLPALVFLYNFHHYKGVVDERLKAGLFERRVDIYTPPLNLNDGQRVSVSQITKYLRKTGYTPAESKLEPGNYQIKKGSLSIYPFDTTVSNVKINLSSDQESSKVERITDLSRGGELKKYELPGLMLGTFSGMERSRRRPVKYFQIPRQLINATLAIEDKRFFDHPGIDIRGILRAATVNFRRGEVVQGGSSITQQLIKTTFRMSQRTYQRKFEEAFLALALEQRLNKEEIFELYVNEVYLGQHGDITVRGISEAANYYFHKDLDQLSLGETAFLAGLIRGPSYYSPVSNPTRAMERRNEVLRAMLDMGAINRSDYEVAGRTPLNVSPQEVLVPEAPYFFDYATAQVQELLDHLPKYGHFKAVVTLDLRMQEIADRVVAKHLDRLRRGRRKNSNKLQASLVALDSRTGDVLAMVGGSDYSESNFNRATTAMRQPGSAFKPFVYTAAFSTGRFNPGTMMRDEAQIFVFDGQEYEPKNYKGKFSGGDVTLRQAFAKSLNTVTVDLAMQVGLDSIADLAERAGLQKPKPYPSMALGTFETTPLEIASAYSVFNNGGKYITPRAIRAIADSDGSILASPPQTVRSVCSPSVAYLMTNLMESVITEGTGSSAGGLRSLSAIAGKTGTSFDGWFIGFTPKMVVAVWVGYDNNKDLKLTGGESALPIWIDFMRDTLELRPDLRGPNFPRPSDVLEVQLDAKTGYMATEFCEETRTELVSAGLEPMPCEHAALAFQLPYYEERSDEITNEELEIYEDTHRSTMSPDPVTEGTKFPVTNVRNRRVLTNSDFEKNRSKGFGQDEEDEDSDDESDEELDEEDD